MNGQLKRFLQHQNWRAAIARLRRAWPAIDSDHTRTEVSPNLYTERDLGKVRVRYPNGPREVDIRSVRDTSGRTWLTFPDAPLTLS